MISRLRRFNINLWITAAMVAASLGAGCASPRGETKPAKKYSKHDQASLRVYLEVNPDGSDRNEPVSIGRQQPFTLNVEKKAFLTERNIERATVVDTLGGFSLSIQYDKDGSVILEQYTAANKGKHMAIAAEFGGQMRWLGAPVIMQRIGDGLLVFTPDATREEAERIASGLNRVAELIRKGRM